MSSSGLDFASAISSRTVFTGSEGCVASTFGVLAISMTGAKSRSASKGALWMSGSIHRRPVVISSV